MLVRYTNCIVVFYNNTGILLRKKLKWGSTSSALFVSNVYELQMFF